MNPLAPAEPILDLKLPLTCLTPDAGHFFYGYYDNPAWSANGRFHLCHHVDFQDRIPEPDDRATIGMIRVADQRFIPLTETTAWNFQQGSMLQWHPQAPDEQIIFNRFDTDRYTSVIRDVRSGTERILSRPVANVDPTGRYGLSINFSRLYDFRPGYGYPHLPDPWRDVQQPTDDGVWLVNLATGKSELILSLAAIAQIEPAVTDDRKLLINHITFNTDGTRFVFLPRTFGTTERPHWKTAIITADMAGHCCPLRPFAYASHYNWRDPQSIVFYSGTETDKALRLLTDQNTKEHLLDPAWFQADGHCNYSPDRRWLAYDSYAKSGYRSLYLYDLVKKQGFTLGRFRSGLHDKGDYRCDLHPRWNRTGTTLSFDSSHEEIRRIYTMDVTPLLHA